MWTHVHADITGDVTILSNSYYPAEGSGGGDMCKWYGSSFLSSNWMGPGSYTANVLVDIVKLMVFGWLGYSDHINQCEK